MVKKDDSGIKSWDQDLAGKTVITQTDSAAQDVLQNEDDGGKAVLAATFATNSQTIGEYNNGLYAARERRGRCRGLRPVDCSVSACRKARCLYAA